MWESLSIMFTWSWKKKPLTVSTVVEKNSRWLLTDGLKSINKRQKTLMMSHLKLCKMIVISYSNQLWGSRTTVKWCSERNRFLKLCPFLVQGYRRLSVNIESMRDTRREVRDKWKQILENLGNAGRTEEMSDINDCLFCVQSNQKWFAFFSSRFHGGGRLAAERVCWSLTWPYA